MEAAVKGETATEEEEVKESEETLEAGIRPEEVPVPDEDEVDPQEAAEAPTAASEPAPKPEASEAPKAEASELALNTDTPIPSAPPGVLEKPKEVTMPDSETKLRAVEQLKAALQKAAALPPSRRQECEALAIFCQCINSLSKATGAAPELRDLYQALPRVGEACFVPLLGIRRSKKAIAAAKPTPAQGEKPVQKSTGRVKSYNTKKGFGFIDMPGFNKDIFVYNSHLIGRIGLLAGEAVEFELVMDNNRPQARQVKVVSSGQNQVVEIPVGVQQLPMGGMVSGPTPPVNRQMGMPSGPQSVNMFGVMKQAMAPHVQPNSFSPNGMGMPHHAQPNTFSSTNEMALAMAAAAAEVPTTLPTQKRSSGGQEAIDKPMAQAASTEDDLFQKIREAQTAAASDKRKPMPKALEQLSHLEPPGSFEDRQVPHALAVAQGRGAEQVAELEAKFTDEGNIPRNATVRVVNFPATEVNDCLGVVQGFDASTARYSVAVDMRKGGDRVGSGETVPLQLKEEYLQVESYPPEARARRPPSQMPSAQASATAASHAPQMPPPTLPVSAGTAQSEALRKSASEALKRFNDSTANTAVPPADMGQWSGHGGPGMAMQHQAMANMAAMAAMGSGKGFGRPPYYPPNSAGPGAPGFQGSHAGRPHGPGSPGIPPSPTTYTYRPGGPDPYARSAIAAQQGKGGGDANGELGAQVGRPHQPGGPQHPGPSGAPPEMMQARSSPGTAGVGGPKAYPPGPDGRQQGGHPEAQGAGGKGAWPMNQQQPRPQQQPPKQGPPGHGFPPGSGPPMPGDQRQSQAPPTGPPQPKGVSLERAAAATMGQGGGARPPMMDHSGAGVARPPMSEARPPAAMGGGIPASSSAPKPQPAMPPSTSMQPPPASRQAPGPEAQRMQPGATATAPPAMPKPSPAAPKPAGPSQQPAGEGRPGARWRALRSEKFKEIIVRADVDVQSKTLRNVQPGEVCVQRGHTVLMESGLVRMQIEPDGGWVTVHARNIQGPTFLEEADAPAPQSQRQVGAPASSDVRLRQGAPQQQQQSQAKAPAKAASAAPPSPDNVPLPQSRAGATTPARERQAVPSKASKGEARWEERRDPKQQQQPTAKSKPSGPIGSAPWQDGEDPWSKNSDPWAKAGDPWAAAAAPRQPARPPAQATRAAPSKASAAPSGHSPRPEKSSWSASAPSSASAVPSGPSGQSYERMELLRVRERLIATSTIKPPPAQIASLRCLRMPDMGGTDRREKRADRDRHRDRDRDRDRRADRQAATEDHDDRGDGSGTAFLRDRGNNTAARDSPLRGEAPRVESTTDRQQRTGQPVPKAGAASSAPSSDATTTAAAGPKVEKQDEQKPKEESKANCPTQ